MGEKYKFTGPSYRGHFQQDFSAWDYDRDFDGYNFMQRSRDDYERNSFLDFPQSSYHPYPPTQRAAYFWQNCHGDHEPNYSRWKELDDLGYANERKIERPKKKSKKSFDSKKEGEVSGNVSLTRVFENKNVPDNDCLKQWKEPSKRGKNSKKSSPFPKKKSEASAHAAGKSIAPSPIGKFSASKKKRVLLKEIFKSKSNSKTSQVLLETKGIKARDCEETVPASLKTASHLNRSLIARFINNSCSRQERAKLDVLVQGHLKKRKPSSLQSISCSEESSSKDSSNSPGAHQRSAPSCVPCTKVNSISTCSNSDVTSTSEPVKRYSRLCGASISITADLDHHVRLGEKTSSECKPTSSTFSFSSALKEARNDISSFVRPHPTEKNGMKTIDAKSLSRSQVSHSVTGNEQRVRQPSKTISSNSSVNITGVSDNSSCVSSKTLKKGSLEVLLGATGTPSRRTANTVNWNESRKICSPKYTKQSPINNLFFSALNAKANVEQVISCNIQQKTNKFPAASIVSSSENVQKSAKAHSSDHEKQSSNKSLSNSRNVSESNSSLETEVPDSIRKPQSEPQDHFENNYNCSDLIPVSKIKKEPASENHKVSTSAINSPTGTQANNEAIQAKKAESVTNDTPGKLTDLSTEELISVAEIKKEIESTNYDTVSVDENEFLTNVLSELMNEASGSNVMQDLPQKTVLPKSSNPENLTKEPLAPSKILDATKKSSSTVNADLSITKPSEISQQTTVNAGLSITKSTEISQPTTVNISTQRNLVEDLLRVTKQEDDILQRRMEIEKNISVLMAQLEEWKAKKVQLEEEEDNLRTKRLAILCSLHGSLESDSNSKEKEGLDAGETNNDDTASVVKSGLSNVCISDARTIGCGDFIEQTGNPNVVGLGGDKGDVLEQQNVFNTKTVAIHKAAITCIEVFENFIYTGSADKTAKRFDMNDMQKVTVYGDFKDRVTALGVSRITKGETLLFTISSNDFCVFIAETATVFKKLMLKCRINCLCIQGDTVFLGMQNGKLVTYNMVRNETEEIYVASCAVRGISTSSQGAQKLLCVMALDGLLTIWDTSSKLLLQCLGKKFELPLNIRTSGDFMFITTKTSRLHACEFYSDYQPKSILCGSTPTDLDVIDGCPIVSCVDGAVRYFKSNSVGWYVHSLCKVEENRKTSIMCLTHYQHWVFVGNSSGEIKIFSFGDLKQP